MLIIYSICDMQKFSANIIFEFDILEDNEEQMYLKKNNKMLKFNIPTLGMH